MFWEKKLAHWVDNIRDHSALPLRLELWNGQYFNFSNESPRVTIRIPRASALGYLLTPSLSNLGEAYVAGKIDVEGGANEIIHIVNALALHTLKPHGNFARSVRTVHHNKERDAEAIRYQYDISNAFYRLWLDENMVYSCAYLEQGDEDLATAEIKRIDHILTKLQVIAGHTLLAIGCGWGA